MTPQQSKASYAAALRRSGEPVTLSRVGVDAAYGPIQARVMGYMPSDLVLDVQQGDRKVVLLADDIEASGFPLPFAEGQDRVDWQGRLLVVKSVDDATRRVSGVLIAYELRVAGA